MNDIYLNIFKLLDFGDIFQCIQVCKTFYIASQNNMLWHYFYNCYYENKKIIGNYYDTCKKYCIMNKINNNFIGLPKNITKIQTLNAGHIVNNTKIPTEIGFFK